MRNSGIRKTAFVEDVGKTTRAAIYIGGIYNKTVAGATGVAVRIDSTGKLGTVLSSARYKEDIKPMHKASEGILALEPVTSRYKQDLDPDGVPQFGLIAEEVEKVNPDLVVRDEDGKVSTVRYEAVNAMLLNEFLKAHRKVETLEGIVTQQQKQIAAQKTTAAQQQKQIEVLTATVQKVSEQVCAQQTCSTVGRQPLNSLVARLPCSFFRRTGVARRATTRKALSGRGSRTVPKS